MSLKKKVSISSKKLFSDDLEFSKKFLQNSKKGGRPQIWYNLDAIISIGYRINSKEATNFRKWSREILKQYMRKGFVIFRPIQDKLFESDCNKFDEETKKFLV